jgi:hypothetical protein
VIVHVTKPMAMNGTTESSTLESLLPVRTANVAGENTLAQLGSSSISQACSLRACGQCCGRGDFFRG